MKKILIVLAILLIVFIASVYILIPSKLDVSAVTTMAAPINGVYRCVINENLWHKWLADSHNSAVRQININNSFLNAVDLSVFDGIDTIKTTIRLLPLVNDSMAVQWKFSVPSGSNPFTRVSRYNKAVRLKKNMDDVLQQLKVFVTNDKNIYGFNVNESSTRDTVLISTKTDLTHYPTNREIYGLIDRLKKYAMGSDAKITGYPMYNVTKVNDDTLRLMAALPINKELPQYNSISPVRMVPGRFLTAQVNGGDSTVRNAFNQMQRYFAEHNRTAMAIPFASLVTDRMEQPDTSKWVTKIYAPVL